MVVLNDGEYAHFADKHELHRLLDEGFADVEAGKGRPATDVFADLKRQLGLGGL